MLWYGFAPVLDGTRPSTLSGWMGPVAPVVTQAVVGAGHWGAGRRRRARAAWVGAAGYGLVAWGLATEAPTAAEASQNMHRLMADLLRERGIKTPVAEQPKSPSRIERLTKAPMYNLAVLVVGMVLGVWSGLRYPRRLTVLAVASQAFPVVFSVARVARCSQQRRPKIAVGSALVAAASVAKLRAVSAEPLR